MKNACVQDWVLKFSDESAAQSWSDKTGDLLRPYPEKDTSKSLRKIGKHAILHHTVYNLTRFFVQGVFLFKSMMSNYHSAIAHALHTV